MIAILAAKPIAQIFVLGVISGYNWAKKAGLNFSIHDI